MPAGIGRLYAATARLRAAVLAIVDDDAPAAGVRFTVTDAECHDIVFAFGPYQIPDRSCVWGAFLPPERPSPLDVIYDKVTPVADVVNALAACRDASEAELTDERFAAAYRDVLDTILGSEWVRSRRVFNVSDHPDPICDDLGSLFVNCRVHLREVRPRLVGELLTLADAAVLIDRQPVANRATDFTWVRSGGQLYTFTPRQAVIIKALWEDMQKGGPGLSDVYLCSLADADGRLLRDVIGKKHPAWKTIIVPADDKGRHRLLIT